MSVKVLYFAWVRERIGKAQEEIELPAEVGTVGELMHWLAGRGEEYASAFANPRVIRAALDRTHVPPETRIGPASEIAFFPPMTGG
jgi:sulfur-carrier protein